MADKDKKNGDAKACWQYDTIRKAGPDRTEQKLAERSELGAMPGREQTDYLQKATPILQWYRLTRDQQMIGNRGNHRASQPSRPTPSRARLRSCRQTTKPAARPPARASRTHEPTHPEEQACPSGTGPQDQSSHRSLAAAAVRRQVRTRCSVGPTGRRRLAKPQKSRRALEDARTRPSADKIAEMHDCFSSARLPIPSIHTEVAGEA